MKNIILIILFFIILILGIYYLRYRYLNNGEVKFVLLETKEYYFLHKDKLPTRLIRNEDDISHFAKEILITDSLRFEILDKLDLSHFDYIISCGYKILRSDFSIGFTNSDGICKDEDPRIPLHIEYSTQTEDSIYIYKIICKKNKYRMPGP